jgi:hypothetical protein
MSALARKRRSLLTGRATWNRMVHFRSILRLNLTIGQVGILSRNFMEIGFSLCRTMGRRIILELAV